MNFTQPIRTHRFTLIYYIKIFMLENISCVNCYLVWLGCLRVRQRVESGAEEFITVGNFRFNPVSLLRFHLDESAFWLESNVTSFVEAVITGDVTVRRNDVFLFLLERFSISCRPEFVKRTGRRFIVLEVERFHFISCFPGMWSWAMVRRSEVCVLAVGHFEVELRGQVGDVAYGESQRLDFGERLSGRSHKRWKERPKIVECFSQIPHPQLFFLAGVPPLLACVLAARPPRLWPSYSRWFGRRDIVDLRIRAERVVAEKRRGNIHLSCFPRDECGLQSRSRRRILYNRRCEVTPPQASAAHCCLSAEDTGKENECERERGRERERPPVLCGLWIWEN